MISFNSVDNSVLNSCKFDDVYSYDPMISLESLLYVNYIEVKGFWLINDNNSTNEDFPDPPLISIFCLDLRANRAKLSYFFIDNKGTLQSGDNP